MTGDEPEYFMAAYSLAHDGDMNLRNNVREESWKAYADVSFISETHGNLDYFQRFCPAMRGRSTEGWKERQLLVHRPGTSVLISPAMCSKERPRWWAYFIITAFACAGAFVIMSAAVNSGVPLFWTVVMSSSFLLSPPGFFYANQAFPEIPTGILLAVAVCLLIQPSLSSALFAAAAVGLTPWFSDRAILPAFFIGLACIMSMEGIKKKLIIISVFAVSAIFLAHYYYNRFGVPYPVHQNPRVSPSLLNIFSLFPRILLDRGRGIVWLFPVFILFPAAFWHWWRSGYNRTLCLFTFSALLANLFVVASFPDWQGGTCPAGRYGVMLQWLVLPAFLVWGRSGISRLQGVMILLPLLFSVTESLFLCSHPNWWYRDYQPLFAYGKIQKWYYYLPDLQNITKIEILKAALWAAVLAVLTLAAVLPLTKRIDIKLFTGCRPARR